MTDVPDLVRVSVVAPIGNSDHPSLPAVISMAQAVPNLCVGRKVLFKHQVNWSLRTDRLLINRSLPALHYQHFLIIIIVIIIIR